jgi:hypothetical protein
VRGGGESTLPGIMNRFSAASDNKPDAFFSSFRTERASFVLMGAASSEAVAAAASVK